MNLLRNILFFYLLTACTSLESDMSHSFRVYEENGISIAETAGRPKYSEPIFAFEEVLQLQQDPSVEESLLYRPGRFTKGPDGYYYVIDRGNHRVAVFDNNGIYQRSFGGEGEGPGTFRSMYFQWLHDGILYIRDFQLNRVTLMRLDGSLIGILLRPRLRTPARRYQLADDCQLLLNRNDYYGENYHWGQAVATIVDATLDTVAIVATDSTRISVSGVLPGSQGRFYTAIQYPGIPCSDYSHAQGILLTDGQSSVIHRYDITGTLIGQIVIAIPPALVTPDERTRIIAEADRKVHEGTGQSQAMAQVMRDLLTIPKEKGWWEEMLIDDAGYVWMAVVEDRFSFEEGGSVTLCDLISPEGKYLGRTRLPAQFDRCVIIDQSVCATIRDEETGDYIPTIFRIQPAVKGLKYP